MSVPTKGETYAQLIEHLRYAQEASAILAHLAYGNDERNLGGSWLQVEELLKKMQHSVTELAMKGLQ